MVDPPKAPNIRVGTSGFSYQDWKGTVYPPIIRESQRLAYYASRFTTLELNSTFYQLPALPAVAGLLRKVPEGLAFGVKAHQDLTHQRKHAMEILPRFLELLKPFRAEGKLGGVLLQFPGSFRLTHESRQYLQGLLECLGQSPVVVKFRHASWLTEETMQMPRDMRVGCCMVDLPELQWLPMGRTWVTSSVGYVRFRGRNLAK